MNDEYTLSLTSQPAEQDIGVLYRGLHDYNTQHSQSGEAEYFGIFVRDPQDQVIAGVYGWTAYGWLRIDVLWVQEEMRGRGFGKTLLAAAEAEGRRRGCRHAILDSFSFQAPELYRKHGYREFAILDDIAPHHTWHFMRKDLAD